MTVGGPAAAAVWRSRLAVGLLAASTCLVAVYVVGVCLRLAPYGTAGRGLFDDAFFFVRYADVFLDTGLFSFNAGQAPVHGNTSQFHQALVTVVYWLTDRDAVLSLLLAGGAGFVIAIPATLLAFACCRLEVSASAKALAALVGTALMVSDRQTILMLRSGMETGWAMAAVALAVAAALQLAHRPRSWVWRAVAAAAVLLTYVTRPDATLVPVVALIALLFSREIAARWTGAWALAMSTVLLGCFLLACWLYYGDALPLAFDIKTIGLSHLPERARSEYLAGASGRYLWFTLKQHVPEIAFCLVPVAMRFRLPPVLLGGLAGAALLLAYHWLLVLPVMGDFGRFYMPALPVFTATAMVALATAAERELFPSWRRFRAVATWTLGAAFGVLVLVRIVPMLTDDWAQWRQLKQADRSLDPPRAALRNAADHYYFFAGRLGELADHLQPSCSIAATEDGLLSVVALHNRIVDMSGLHDRRVARRGLSVDRLLSVGRPDVLVMPHPSYGPWTAEITQYPAFVREYQVQPPLGGGATPVAFRRASDCAQSLRRALYPGSGP